MMAYEQHTMHAQFVGTYNVSAMLDTSIETKELLFQRPSISVRVKLFAEVWISSLICSISILRRAK